MNKIIEKPPLGDINKTIERLKAEDSEIFKKVLGSNISVYREFWKLI